SNDDFNFGSTTGNDPSTNTTTFGIRHHFVSMTHKSMGTVSLGQTSSASDGTMETTLGGASATVLSGNTMLGSIRFTTGANGAFTGFTAAAQPSVLDGLDLTDVIRYYTPTFAGFTVATSHLGNGAWDVAARYSGKIAGLDVAGAAFFANQKGGTGGKLWGVSGTVAHASGISLRANYGGQHGENTGLKTKVWMVSGDYAAKLSSLGSTHFFVEFYRAEDVANAGFEMDTFYVGVVQKLESIGSEMSLTCGKHTLDDPASTDYNDIDALMFQTLLAF
ncbi:MAG: hypothetical protein VW338_19560, partial [Rhodospirillaceae bacterium]